MIAILASEDSLYLKKLNAQGDPGYDAAFKRTLGRLLIGIVHTRPGGLSRELGIWQLARRGLGRRCR